MQGISARDWFARDWLISQLYCNCYCLSRKPVLLRICGGLAVPCTKAICGGDGFARDFGRSRYENLSGAISWLTFFAGAAADVRRSRRDWRRELAESTIGSQWKPRSVRCSVNDPASYQGQNPGWRGRCPMEYLCYTNRLKS